MYGRPVLAMDCALAGAEGHHGRLLNGIVRHQESATREPMALKVTLSAQELVRREIERTGVPDPVVNIVQFGERGPLLPAVHPRSRFPKRVFVDIGGITFCFPRYIRWLLPVTLDAVEGGLVLRGPFGKVVWGRGT